MAGNVVPPLRDDVQLSVDEYRNKLYEFINTGGGQLTSNLREPSRAHRPIIPNQRTVHNIPQAPPPPTRQRSLILRPREHAESQTVHQRPQTVVKRSNTSMVSLNLIRNILLH